MTPRTDAEQAIFGQTLEEHLDDLSALPRAMDLRTIPRERWVPGWELALPPAIERWIDGQTTFSTDEVHAIEEALEKHHGITAPFAAYLFVPTVGRPTASLITG